jgi:hypothetical protein
VIFQWLSMKNRLPRVGILPTLADPKSDRREWENAYSSSTVGFFFVLCFYVNETRRS